MVLGHNESSTTSIWCGKLKNHNKSFMPTIYNEFKIIILYIIGIMWGIEHVILQDHRNFVSLGFFYVSISQKLVENWTCIDQY
jgi:hypothetical protein